MCLFQAMFKIFTFACLLENYSHEWGLSESFVSDILMPKISPSPRNVREFVIDISAACMESLNAVQPVLLMIKYYDTHVVQ